MNKFQRFNKLTEKKEDFLGCDGTLKSITENAIANKGTNGKAFFRFTADIETPSGVKTVGGQVYEGLIPHIGGMPQVGARMQFSSKIEDLREKRNGRWNIGGAAFDAIDDEFLAEIDDL